MGVRQNYGNNITIYCILPIKISDPSQCLVDQHLITNDLCRLEEE